jgi:GNAT superfamily N-acetyltransferase
MVDPTWQGAGLATLLHGRTAEYAAGHGVRGFTADVLPHNASMLYVFRRGDHDTTVTMEDGVCEIRMLFRQLPEGAA